MNFADAQDIMSIVDVTRLMIIVDGKDIMRDVVVINIMHLLCVVLLMTQNTDKKTILVIFTQYLIFLKKINVHINLYVIVNQNVNHIMNIMIIIKS